MKYLKY